MKVINTVPANHPGSALAAFVEERIQEALGKFPEEVEGVFPNLEVVVCLLQDKDEYDISSLLQDEDEDDSIPSSLEVGVTVAGYRICEGWIPSIGADLKRFYAGLDPWDFLWKKVVSAYLKAGNPFPQIWAPLITDEWFGDYEAVPDWTGQVEEEIIVLAQGRWSQTNKIVFPTKIPDLKSAVQTADFCGITLIKLSPGVVVKTIYEADQEAREEKARAKEESLEKAQAFLGWTIVSISKEGIQIKSPSGETAIISHAHEVWDYGNASRSWLTIGDLNL